VISGTIGSRREAVIPSGTLRCVVLCHERNSEPSVESDLSPSRATSSTHKDVKGTVKASRALMATYVGHGITREGQDQLSVGALRPHETERRTVIHHEYDIAQSHESPSP
jgi:hypothetical protein